MNFELVQKCQENQAKSIRNKEIVEALNVLDSDDIVYMILGIKKYMSFTEPTEWIKIKDWVIETPGAIQWIWNINKLQETQKEKLIGVYITCKLVVDKIKK